MESLLYMQLSHEKFSKKLVSTALSGLFCEDETYKLENSIALRLVQMTSFSAISINFVCCYFKQFSNDC